MLPISNWPQRRQLETLLVSDATVVRASKKQQWTGAYACLASTGEHRIVVKSPADARHAAVHEADGLYACLALALRHWSQQSVLIVSDQGPIARIEEQPDRIAHLLMQVLCRSSAPARDLLELLEALLPEIEHGRIRMRWASGHQGTSPLERAVRTADTYARAAAIGLIDPDDPPPRPPSRGSIDRALGQLRRGNACPA